MKSIRDFNRRAASRDGLRSQCRKCDSDYNKLNPYPKDKKAEKDKQYYNRHKEKIRKYKREWAKLNRDRLNSKAKELRDKNMEYKLACNLRTRTSRALTKGKTGSAIKDLGCTVGELKLYLESKFQPGMTWDNYGRTGWHIDHVKPLANFDLTNPKEFKKAAHYTNLQPLWAEDNVRKSNG